MFTLVALDLAAITSVSVFCSKLAAPFTVLTRLSTRSALFDIPFEHYSMIFTLIFFYQSIIPAATPSRVSV
jgi:hypothetical protein